MVANLSAHKPGWDERWEEFSVIAERGQEIMNRLLDLVDRDTEAFNLIMEAIGMPKGTEAERRARALAMEKATLHAAQVPLETARTACEAFEVLREMVLKGNPASVSDAGVGAAAVRAAVIGAAMNVHINARSLEDKAAAEDLCRQADELINRAKADEEEILNTAWLKIK